MAKHTVEELMKLLGDLTGWSNQSLAISIGYKQARVWESQDESHLTDEWGFVVDTTVCEADLKVSAQGPTLPEALYKLALSVIVKQNEDVHRRAERRTKSEKLLEKFLADNVDTLPGKPYR